MPVLADEDDGVRSASFAYTLNSAMLNCGVISTPEYNGYTDISESFPSGVIYSDIVRFTDTADPCLMIVYADSVRGCISTDIYRYDKKDKTSKIITTIRKPYGISSSCVAELSLADDGEYRYIVYREYSGEETAVEEYYTVIKNNAFSRVETPDGCSHFGILSFTDSYIHPEVDVSEYNEPLSIFFSLLKDYSASSVTYKDILDDLTADERTSLSRVLSKCAEFDYPFDIGNYSSMSEYSLAVNEHDGCGVFNAITNFYALGDEIYYIRYSTDLCFYNGAILRRTDKVSDKYQILAVRNDFIPFSDSELNNLKEAYLKNRLVLEKADTGAETKSEPLIKVNKLDFEKPLSIPKKMSSSLRKPIAFIGGGVCLGLFILLWVIFTKNNDNK